MKKRSVGISLIELVVAIGILSIVAAGMAQVFDEGLRLFRANQNASDAQSSAIKTLARINTELINAKSELVRFYSAPDVPGIVFASPIDENGQALFHPDTGAVYWQRYVCYYHVPDATDPENGKLYRAESRIPDEIGIATGRTGNSRVSEVEAAIPDTNSFASGSADAVRLMGTNISGFEVREFTGNVENSATGDGKLGGTGITRDLSLDVVLEAGLKDDKGPDAYYIRVDSRVTPRG